MPKLIKHNSANAGIEIAGGAKNVAGAGATKLKKKPEMYNRMETPETSKSTALNKLVGSKRAPTPMPDFTEASENDTDDDDSFEEKKSQTEANTLKHGYNLRERKAK